MRRQGSESVSISDEERRQSNDALGPVPWCTMTECTEDTLRRAMDRHYRTRQQALRSLAGLLAADQEGLINLDFVDRYASYFYVDDPCLCDVLPGRGRVLAAGGVGVASTVDVNQVPLVVKCIPDVALKKYLSLRVSPYTAAARDAVRPMNASNELNTFRTTTEQPVHLHVPGDSFSNQTCMHMILNLLLGDRPNYVYQYDAFYCTDKGGATRGCNIMERAGQGDLSTFLERTPVDAALVTDVVTQLLPTLFSLKAPDLGFVHADLKCRNVFVARDDQGRPVFKLADYDKSSIYFRGVRFHNTSRLTTALPYNSFPIQETLEGEQYYRLSTTATYLASFAAPVGPGAYIQLQTMYNPYGFYMSYDVYTFMFSLLMEPAVWPYFYRMYRKQDQDRNWFGWSALWFPDDLDSVMAYIQVQHERYDDLVQAGLGEDAVRQLTKMRSMRNMNDAFANLGWKFKVNVMRAYTHLVGTNIIPAVSKAYEAVPRQRVLKLSRGNRVCIQPCQSGWCNTNRYSHTGYTGATYVYDWDYC